MESSVCNLGYLFKRFRKIDLIFTLCVVHHVLLETECRNIRGHSRYSRRRPDPHVVDDSFVPKSTELEKEAIGHVQGRRCQVTEIEDAVNFFELPYYNEGRTILPFFFKISMKSKIKPGNL